MRFSIIVPVYNAERYLPEAVASVTGQTFADFELLLVDDGSAAPCARLCDSLAASDGRIKALHRENGGQLTARLDGVAAAAGEYCVFLDADDLLMPNALSVLDAAVRRYGAPDMIVYSFLYEEPDGAFRPAAKLFEAERRFAEAQKKELYSLFLTTTGLNNVWTKAVKRSVFQGEYPDYAPFKSLRVGEDRLLSMGLATNAREIVYLPDTLCRYRLFPGSVTRQFSPGAVDRFNVSVLYPCEADYLRQWGMLDHDTLLRLNACFIAQALSVFDRLWRRLDAPGRRSLAGYSWGAFLPKECLNDYPSNPYLNDVQKRLLSMLLSGDFNGLRMHYMFKNAEKKLRAIKRKLIS